MPIDRGSTWRRWDLQVHTPASIVHRYPGASEDEKWTNFIAGLEALPDAFAVVAISDYLFLDGYKHLLEVRKQDHVRKLDLVLPAVELRIRAFGGTESKLRKANLHVIFSDELEPELIEAQFLAALTSKVKLTPDGLPHALDWKAVLTRDSLADLGRKIIESVPPAKRPDYRAPLIEGFNNITFDLDDVQEALDSHYFKNKYLLALGKTEWASIKWTDQSVADKKTLINSVDIVLISSPNPGHYQHAKASLKAANVNDTLLDCSDAHSLSSSKDKDRLGNCFTWIKADPVFTGLKHALIEREERIFVGDEPEQLTRVRANPRIFLDSLKIQRKPVSQFQEVWFDKISIPLNPGLVTVIGNKGMGKSALAEAMATACGTEISKQHFSFLTKRRFCQPKENKAEHFEIEVRTTDQHILRARLSDDPGRKSDPQVFFLPQNYLEKLCAEPDTLVDFTSRLEEVVFSHVPDTSKLGRDSLHSLVGYLSAETQKQLERLRLELSHTNREIVQRSAEISAENYDNLTVNYRGKQGALKALRSERPKKRRKPKIDTGLALELEQKQAETETIERLEARATKKLTKLQEKMAAAANVKEGLINLEDELGKRTVAWQRDLGLVGLSLREVFSYQVNTNVLEGRIRELAEATRPLEKFTNGEYEHGFRAHRARLRREILALRGRLQEPARRYQAYLDEEQRWWQRRRDLIGNSDKPGSALYLRKRLFNIRKVVPGELEGLKGRRRQQAREIFRQIMQLRDTYQKLHDPVQNFIAQSPQLKDDLDVRFEVVIEPYGLKARFFALIHHGRRGSFIGAKKGAERLSALMEGNDFFNEDQAIRFAEELLLRLENDYSTVSREARAIHDQLMEARNVVEVLDLIFGFDYLTPRYVLRMGERGLGTLSPGERGLLLLVFYLVVSKDRRPIIIDQPEGNLDNESIFDILVPCIRKARRTRQIILVTHNPNLAVVCDSEQIIRACIDKSDGYRVTYTGGSIENPEVNKWLVDVLEGTWPAFDKRTRRYFPPLGRIRS